MPTYIYICHIIIMCMMMCHMCVMMCYTLNKAMPTYIYICMHPCVYTHMHHTYTYICIYVSLTCITHIHMYVYIHTCIIHMHMYVYMYLSLSRLCLRYIKQGDTCFRCCAARRLACRRIHGAPCMCALYVCLICVPYINTKPII